MEKLKEGSLVHIVMENGEHRPAICVKAWNDTCGNFQVFIDGSNDRFASEEYQNKGIMWMTSVGYSEEKPTRTWHWPENN